MGLNKSELSAGEIIERMNAIDAQVGAKDYAKAFNAALELEEVAPNYGAYFLGACYHNGWSVEQNIPRAYAYYCAATSIDNGYLKYVWYLGGLLLLNFKKEYSEAADWLEKAENLGATDASMHLARTYLILAQEFRKMANQTIRVDECSRLIATSAKYAVRARHKYLGVAERNPAQMNYINWICFGRTVQMLYSLACRGELSFDAAEDNTLQSYLGNGLNIMTGRMNEDLHRQYLASAAQVCSVMDKCGWEIIGEYFRAACALLDSELHQSAEAFYRVRWHMKRIGELRPGMDPNILAEIDRLLADVLESFKKMDKKYGSSVVSMVRAGKMPNLSPSYPAGGAPAPESCANFMRMYEELRNIPVASGSKNENKKGLFGFFKKKG